MARISKHGILISLAIFLLESSCQTTTAPVPYASPLGFSSDVTAYLSPINVSTSGISAAKTNMFTNINYQSSAPGTVIAALSFTAPNYAYNWVRDASLTMTVVQTLYAATNSSAARDFYSQILLEYASARKTEQDANNTQTGLGEPKWELNNTVFTGPWGRPQNDGPATSSIVLMEFLQKYLSLGGNSSTIEQTWPVPLTDLNFVASNWSWPCFDIWEEVESQHFYNRMVSYKALKIGAIIAQALNDSTSVTSFNDQAASVLTSLTNDFWNSEGGYLQYDNVGAAVQRDKTSGLDAAVILGVLRGNSGDGVMSYANDQVLATAYSLAVSFLNIYPIASQKTDGNGGLLGIPIGRYPEDVYNGDGTAPNGGNPWFLCTAGMAELFYLASVEISQNGTLVVSQTSLSFWTYFAPSANLSVGTYSSTTSQFTTAVQALQGWGDAFIRLIRYHGGDSGGASGHLGEEYDRNSGYQVGAPDLTWTYASLLTAGMARAQAMGDEGYVTTLANLGYE